MQALGGAKNHMVGLPDADLDQAADALAGAAYGSAGERCIAISVGVVVGDETGDALIERPALGAAAPAGWRDRGERRDGAVVRGLPRRPRLRLQSGRSATVERTDPVSPQREFGDWNGGWKAAIGAAFVVVDVDASAKQAGTVRIPDEPNPPLGQARDGTGERRPQRQEVGAVGRGCGCVSFWAENGRSSEEYGVIWDISRQGADARAELLGRKNSYGQKFGSVGQTRGTPPYCA